MANVKISDLTGAASASGTQEFEVNDSGTSKKVTGSQLATFIEGEVSSNPTLTGQVSLDNGTSTTPSLTNTGDTNTGLYFPSDDTVGLAAGGGLKLSANASGVDITGTLTSDGLTVDGASTAEVLIKAADNAETTFPLVIENNANSLDLGIGAYGLDNTIGVSQGSDFKMNVGRDIIMRSDDKTYFKMGTGGDISFYEDTGTTPKFFWQSSLERLGIGTSSPSTPLHVNGAATISGITYSTALVNTTNGTSYFTDASTGNGLYVGGSTGSPANTVRILTNATERMRIDSSGTTTLQQTKAYGSETAVLRVRTITTGTNYSSGTFQNIVFGDETIVNSYFGQLAVVQENAAASTASTMRFYTNGGGGNAATQERMRIDSGGNLLVGATTAHVFGIPSLQVGGSNANGLISVRRNVTTAADQVIFYNPNGLVGRIQTNGSSTSYVTSSDYRLKTDAQPMTGASARVQALNPVNFEWIADGTRVDGFLAHEAQEVVPEAVTGTKDAMRDEEYEVTPAVYEDVVIPAVLDEDGNELEAERTEQRLVSEAVMGTRSVPDYQGIDQSKLVPLLTAALQEALIKIDALETRITALEG